MPLLRTLAAACLALATVGLSPGRYELAATARVDASGVPAREYEGRVLALVGPGDRPDTFRIRLASRGYECDLTGRADRGGAVSLEAGQLCRFEVDQEEARGRIDATLRSGSGRLDGEALELKMEWELRGALRTRLLEGGARLPGTDVRLGDAWTPDVPVRGTAKSEARGRRETPAR